MPTGFPLTWEVGEFLSQDKSGNSIERSGKIFILSVVASHRAFSCVVVYDYDLHFSKCI
jgi:hypothetical protein